MQETSNMLKSAREKSVNEIKKLQSELEAAVQKIREDPKIKATDIDTIYTSLVKQVDKQMVGLQDMVKQQKIAEEQDRLRKIQQEMEAEKRRKIEEEARKKEEEDNRKKKIEIEARRKAEEEQRKKQEEEDRKTAAAIQVNSFMSFILNDDFDIHPRFILYSRMKIFLWMYQSIRQKS